MKLSFATLGCPTWSIPEIVRHAAKMGFDGVELRGVAGEHIGPDEPPASCAAILQMFQQHHLEVACISAYSRLTSDDEARRQADVASLRHMLRVAADVECRTIRFFGGHLADDGREKSRDRLISSLEQLLPDAERYGVCLAIETHDDWTMGSEIHPILTALTSPALGVCWDVGNSCLYEPLLDNFTLLRDRIVHVHLKDVKRSADGSVHSVLPGRGETPLAQALSLLQYGSYQGYLSFEWEKKWEPDLEDPQIAFPAYIDHVTQLMQRAGVQRTQR